VLAEQRGAARDAAAAAAAAPTAPAAPAAAPAAAPVAAAAPPGGSAGRIVAPAEAVLGEREVIDGEVGPSFHCFCLRHYHQYLTFACAIAIIAFARLPTPLHRPVVEPSRPPRFLPPTLPRPRRGSPAGALCAGPGAQPRGLFGRRSKSSQRCRRAARRAVSSTPRPAAASAVVNRGSVQ